MRPPATPTSARLRGAPVPSTTVPFADQGVEIPSLPPSASCWTYLPPTYILTHGSRVKPAANRVTRSSRPCGPSIPSSADEASARIEGPQARSRRVAETIAIEVEDEQATRRRPRTGSSFWTTTPFKSTQGVVRRLHQPERQGPVLKPDRSRDQTLVAERQCAAVEPRKGSLGNGGTWGFTTRRHTRAPALPSGGTSTTPRRPDRGGVGAPKPGAVRVAGLPGQQPGPTTRRSTSCAGGACGTLSTSASGGCTTSSGTSATRTRAAATRPSSPTATTSDRYPGLSPDGFRWTFPHVEGIRSDDTSQLIYDDYNDRFVGDESSSARSGGAPSG